MKKFMLAAATAAVALFAAPVSANDHNVIIEKRGIYPATLYVQPGDTITYTNRSYYNVILRSRYYDRSADLNYQWYYAEEDDEYNPFNAFDMLASGECASGASGQSLPWSSGTVGHNQTLTIVVGDCAHLTLQPPFISGVSYTNSYRSNIVFGSAPLGF